MEATLLSLFLTTVCTVLFLVNSVFLLATIEADSTGSSCPPKSTNYGGRVHTDSPRWIDGYPTNVGVLWMILQKKMVALKVLPASHHSEVIPTKEYFDSNSIQVECKKGSLIVFNLYRIAIEFGQITAI